MTGCPPLDDLRRLADDTLPEHESALLAEHVNACPQCKRELEGLTSPPPRQASPGPESPTPPWVAGPVAPPDLPRYEVLGKLGEGGMGAVYHARDRLLGREVALKVIRPAALSAGALRRFDAEARAVARLDHPHVVKVFDVGVWGGGGTSAPYLALEYVPGGSLAGRLTGRPAGPADSARLVRLLARALAHAHERGVTHRDLKPDNVLLAPPAEVVAL